MKKILLMTAAALFLGAGLSHAQKVKSDFEADGTVSYALPITSLTFDVDAVQEKFYAGPYAKFAQKYLGIEVREKDEQTYHLSGVKITPSIEADQSKRYVITLDSKGAAAAFLQMTSQGLVATRDGSFGDESVWRFPVQSSGDFSDKGVASNYTAESATLYQNVKQESAYNKVAVQQNMVVEKTLEKKAQEAAEMIFSLRKTRVQIITGDTDANYSGGAMGAALEEIARLEKEYMTLFTGYTVSREQSGSFDIIPSAGARKQQYPAFRLNGKDGIVTDGPGTIYYLEFTPEEISDVQASVKDTKNVVHYRIPAACNVRLTSGGRTLFESRIPVYQLGLETLYPLK